MRERSPSGFASDLEEDISQTEKKKLKTSDNSSCDDVESPMQDKRQDDFEIMWDKLVLQFRRMLQLKTVEAVRIAEEAYNLSIKGCYRPRLIEETEKLLHQFCSSTAQSLSTLSGTNLLREYYRNWRTYLLSIQDIDTLIKIFRIEGMVKRAFSSWSACLFSPLQCNLKLALNENPHFAQESSFMDICSISEPSTEIPDYTNLQHSLSDEETFAAQEASLFASYHQEFHEIFKLESILKQLFPVDELQVDDEDEFLYEDILKTKLPNVNIASTKEEGNDFGIAYPSLLPSEIVFEIFTFLSTEKELKVAGQVCRRWYVLTKQRSLWHALKARKAISREWVRMLSREGHEFTLGLSEANRSGTLASVLKMHTALEAKTHTVRFTTIRSHVLEKIVQYFYYKVMYTSSTSTIPEFPIEPEIALEILMASNFLDC